MNPISLFQKTQITQPAHELPAAQQDRLEAVLIDLAKWGKPRISMPSGDGWYSSIEVNITPTGAKFEVSSDFKMATPLAAALQCRERLLASVKALGGAA